MKTSQKGIELIKKFEGCALNAYKCPAGVLTIGYGHTNNVRVDDVITQKEAEDLLKIDLAQFEAGVSAAVKVALTQEQFDALVSFTYNLGVGALQSSTLLKKLNAGDYAGAADQFPLWNKVGRTIFEGLVRRRAAEKDLFLSKTSKTTKRFEIEPLGDGNVNLYVDGVLKFPANKKETVIDYLNKNI